MISCLWYNEWRGAESPFLKNLLNGIGIRCFLAGPLEVLVLGSGSGGSLLGYPRAVQWLTLIAFAIITTSHRSRGHWRRPRPLARRRRRHFVLRPRARVLAAGRRRVHLARDHGFVDGVQSAVEKIARRRYLDVEVVAAVDHIILFHALDQDGVGYCDDIAFLHYMKGLGSA